MPRLTIAVMLTAAFTGNLTGCKSKVQTAAKSVNAAHDTPSANSNELPCEPPTVQELKDPLVPFLALSCQEEPYKAGPFYEKLTLRQYQAAASRYQKNNQKNTLAIFGPTLGGQRQLLLDPLNVSDPTSVNFGAGQENCFTAGTKISTPDGQRNIERLRIGDSVISLDLIHGHQVTSIVTGIYITAVDDVGSVRLSDGRTIQVTSDHPFYVPARRAFLPAHELAAGMILMGQFSNDQGHAPIVDRDFSVDSKTGGTTVYNLTVSGQHNYFAEGILVHNKGIIDPSDEGPNPDEQIDGDDDDTEEL